MSFVTLKQKDNVGVNEDACELIIWLITVRTLNILVGSEQTFSLKGRVKPNTTLGELHIQTVKIFIIKMLAYNIGNFWYQL